MRVKNQFMMENNIIISQPSALESINRSEIDMQIATAKQFPRDIHAALDRIQTLATMDSETAAECFYVLYRKDNSIEGVSVRLAEIIAGAWGNLRVQTRIVANDGKTITAQGICHDLETNYAVSVEVKRRITDKYGKTFSDDMVVVTGNAASAIAYRNAVLKVVPKAVTKKVIEEVKRVSMGQALDMTTTLSNMLANFAKLGVSEKEILDLLEVKSREEITQENVMTMRGLFTAIREGTTTVKESIKDVLAQRAAESAQEKKANSISEKIQQNKMRLKAARKASEKPAEEQPTAVIPVGEVDDRSEGVLTLQD